MTKVVVDHHDDSSSVATAHRDDLDSDSSCASSCTTSSKKTLMTWHRWLTQTLLCWRSRVAGHFHRRLYGGTGIDLVDQIFVKYNITHGLLYLLVPLLVCMSMTLFFTFPGRRNTGQSGVWAYYALMYTFLLAHKQASIFQLIGLSWEQLVGVHKLASIVSMTLSLLHGFVAYTGHDYVPCREPTAEELLQNNGSRWLDVAAENYDDAAATGTMDTSMPICGDLRLENNPRFRYSLIGDDANLWKFLWDGGRNASGSSMLTCLLALLLLSSFRATLRGPCFDLWLASHIAAAGAILAYADKHRIKLFIVLVVWWGVDGLLRYGLGSLLRLPKTATMKLLSRTPVNGGTGKLSADDLKNAIVELTFDTKFHYEAGQYIRVAIMETGQPVMFHPMTISSAPYQDKATLHFRPVGGWTNQLARMASKHQQDNQLTKNDHKEALTTATGYKVHVMLEGPYGNVSINLWNDPGRFPVVVLIAGGIGVTPMTSLVRQLLHEHNHVAGRQRKQIRVVWAVRDIAMVEALPLLGPDCHISSPKELVSQSKKKLSGSKELCVGDESPVEKWPDSETVLKANIFITRKDTKKASITKMNRKKVIDEFFVDPPDLESSFDEISKARNPVPLSSLITKTQETAENIITCSSCVDYGFYSFHSGRPDVKAILEQSASLVEGGERVAVIACGPSSLVQSAKEAAAQLTCGSSTSFDFHEEVFLL